MTDWVKFFFFKKDVNCSLCVEICHGQFLGFSHNARFGLKSTWHWYFIPWSWIIQIAAEIMNIAELGLSIYTIPVWLAIEYLFTKSILKNISVIIYKINICCFTLIRLLGSAKGKTIVSFHGLLKLQQTCPRIYSTLTWFEFVRKKKNKNKKWRAL